MSNANSDDSRRIWTRNRGRPDYKEKLERTRFSPPTETAVDVLEAMEEELPYAEQLRSLAERKHIHGVAFQSVAVAAVQVLNETLFRERRAASVAISMAQRERLDQMIVALEATNSAICTMLNAQGRKMLDLSAANGGGGGKETSWWFALTEAIESIENGIETVTSIVSRQPKGGAARTLSSVVTRVLRRHQHAMLAEADEWMGS